IRWPAAFGPRREPAWGYCPARGATMIKQRQIDFRQEYRSRIIGWYDGYFHVALIYAMGAAAFYVYVAHIHHVTWLEWLTVPLTFGFTNLVEWGGHIHRIACT